MEQFKGKFGFGFMRLPMQGEEVDTAAAPRAMPSASRPASRM